MRYSLGSACGTGAGDVADAIARVPAQPEAGDPSAIDPRVLKYSRDTIVHQTVTVYDPDLAALIPAQARRVMTKGAS